jgi:hypothetical protein
MSRTGRRQGTKSAMRLKAQRGTKAARRKAIREWTRSKASQERAVS